MNTGIAIKPYTLHESDYYKQDTPKNQIVLHHTAGSCRPDWTIDGWKSDEQGRVATAYVIGGKCGDKDEHNGKILEAFSPKYWAHHLGVKNGNNVTLNRSSIGIELCNWGYAVEKKGMFYSYAATRIPAEEITTLDVPWRGYRHWHKYTDEQLDSARALILHLSERFEIPVKKVWSAGDFYVTHNALHGRDGLWTHSQFRSDKFDCYPSPELIQMLNSL